MPIDTSDLSNKTYKAIMVEAERFDCNLTLQFGLLSYECKNEKNFITKSKQLIHEMLNFDLQAIEDVFFGEPPQKKDLHRVLNKILKNIAALN